MLLLAMSRQLPLPPLLLILPPLARMQPPPLVPLHMPLP
jgi:hypothetical protein